MSDDRITAEIEEAEDLSPGVWEAADRGVSASVGFLALDWSPVPWHKRLWRWLFPPRFEIEAMSGPALCLRPGRKPHVGDPATAGGHSGTNPLGPRESAGG